MRETDNRDLTEMCRYYEARIEALELRIDELEREKKEREEA